MNKIIKKISGALQLVLMAPVKLPGKALQVLKYVALGLGILETVMHEQEETVEPVNGGTNDQGKDAEIKPIIEDSVKEKSSSPKDKENKSQRV